MRGSAEASLYRELELTHCSELGDTSLLLSMTVVSEASAYKNLLTSLNGKLNVSATPL